MTHAAAAYENRKKVVDVQASQEIFSLEFAVAALEAGETAGRGRKPSVPSRSNIRDRIGPEPHGTLARCCLAYLLAHENAHDPEERSAYRMCLRRIRDGARETAEAADELAAQVIRHHQETGKLEARRATTLLRLAHALHGDFRNGMDEIFYREKIRPRPIGSPLSDHAVVHGLTGCTGLFNEAERILEELGAPPTTESTDPQVSVGMTPGNKTDADMEAFVIDLRNLFKSVVGRRPTANSNADGSKSPFVRFVDKVFKELREQRMSIFGQALESTFDKKAFTVPSTSTLKRILNKP